MKNSRESAIGIHLVSSNRLAGEFLRSLLAKESTTRVDLWDHIPSTVARTDTTVFVVELSSTVFPSGECLRKLRSRFPQAKVLVIDRPLPNEEIARLLQGGIHGFLRQSDVSTTLRTAICAVAAGRYWVSDEAMQYYVEYTSRSKQRSLSGPSSLTARESQVFEFVGRRLPNKEIADILGLKESTIKYHLSNIFGKLNVNGRNELAMNKEILKDQNQL